MCCGGVALVSSIVIHTLNELHRCLVLRSAPKYVLLMFRVKALD